MKIVLILLGIIVLSFVAIQLFAMRSQNGIETYPYELIKEYENFEIRKYEARLFTSVKINSKSYDKTSRRGFSVLAGYIFGDNQKNEKIAMTSPVTMTLEDTTTMMFMVPKEFDQSSLPEPNNKDIDFYEAPTKTVAAIRFGGWANDDKIENYKQKLIAGLEKEGISHTGKFQFFGYNAPYEMTNRRNEIIVELIEE